VILQLASFDASLCLVKLPSSLVHTAGAMLLWEAPIEFAAGDPTDRVIRSHWVARLIDNHIANKVISIPATEDMQFCNPVFMMGEEGWTIMIEFSSKTVLQILPSFELEF
jgi:hypothetical protein